MTQEPMVPDIVQSNFEEAVYALEDLNECFFSEIPDEKLLAVSVQY